MIVSHLRTPKLTPSAASGTYVSHQRHVVTQTNVSVKEILGQGLISFDASPTVKQAESDKQSRVDLTAEIRLMTAQYLPLLKLHPLGQTLSALCSVMGSVYGLRNHL